ncbi:MAG: hypothetical protein HPY59_02990 [Anaerolineae bacterium]|nr:hypothetical protein [Anaerolineae bacterium]
MDVFTVEMLRTLKGPPLAVLIALMIAGQPVQNDWLARVTGYTDKPVRQALELLKDYGMVTRNGRYAWQVAGSVQQLPFLAGSQNYLESPAEEDQPGWKNSESLTTTTATIVDCGDKPQQKQKNLKTSRKNSDFDIKKCLYDAGIREPTLSQLEALPWVTLDYVQAMVKQARREKIGTGLLVHRIRCNDLVQHPAGCGCAWCSEQSSKRFRESLRAAGYDEDE